MNSKFYLNTLRAKKEVQISVDQKSQWLNGILKDLTELELDKQSYIQLDATLKFHRETGLNEFVTMEGQLVAEYNTLDITSGDEMRDKLTCNIDVVYLDQDIHEKMGLEEETTYYIDEKEYELYPYDAYSFDIEEAINEQAQLNKNPYPKKQAQDNI